MIHQIIDKPAQTADHDHEKPTQHRTQQRNGLENLARLSRPTATPSTLRIRTNPNQKQQFPRCMLPGFYTPAQHTRNRRTENYRATLPNMRSDIKTRSSMKSLHSIELNPTTGWMIWNMYRERLIPASHYVLEPDPTITDHFPVACHPTYALSAERRRTVRPAGDIRHCVTCTATVRAQRLPE